MSTDRFFPAAWRGLRRAGTAAALVLALATATRPRAEGGEGPGFAAAPAAVRSDGKVRVTFTASGPTDVAVCVLDARGEVVRHLAAGVLGPKAPPPLAPGLAQSLEWDGQDDWGRPAAGGPFKARVALGLRPRFDRMIGHNPAVLNDVRGLAVGPDGTVYVFSTCAGTGSGASHGRVLAFDRNGRYLRQVVPYPASLPEEKLKGLRRVEIAPGVRAPFVYNAETRGLFPGLGGEHGMSRGVVTGDGRLALPGVMEVFRDGHKTARVVVVRTDGSAPDGVLGPAIHKSTRDPGSLALSPDGKKLYLTGVRDGPYVTNKVLGTVFSCGWDGREVSPFISTGLSDPRSVAVDGDGNLYVADKGNDRVAVFKPDGSVLGELKVEKPERVEVHPRTGAVYVLGGAGVNELRKFASWREPAAVATAKLPSFRHRYYSALIALDASAEPPVIWVGSAMGYFARFGLLRLEDRGKSFGEPADIAKLPENSGPTTGRSTDLALGGGRLCVWPQRGSEGPYLFDARTGQPATVAGMPRPVDRGLGFIFSAGGDGNFYMLSGHVQGNDASSSLFRFDSAFKPLPFPEAKDGKVTDLGSPRTRLRGMCVDGRGTVYTLCQKVFDPAAPRGVDHPHADANRVGTFGPDGKAVNARLVDSDLRNLNSVRCDPAGNVYLAVGVHPGDEALPAHLAGKLPAGREDPDADCGYNYYPLMYGSIVKFPPSGGEIRVRGEGRAVTYAYDRKAFVKGAEWIFFGASLVPSWVHGTGFRPDICACESPRFDVDGFGRSFFGDACGFRVGVLDTGGNLITWFGSYGNQDSPFRIADSGLRIGGDTAARSGRPAAGNSKSEIHNPKSAIPLGWVHAVAVDDEAAFVGDRLNQRVVRVALDYAAEAGCALP